MKRKGIILAGGSGTRLYPLTNITSKQLLPVYDKPLIFYPLTTLMLANIREILIITTEEDRSKFENFIGTGEQWGLDISYAIQKKPEGIAQSLIIAKDFIINDAIALILGDNIFFGNDLSSKLITESEKFLPASLFLYHVNDPENYGVVKFDKNLNPIDVIEKPREYTSNFAVTGLYFYNNDAISIAEKLKPSARGELEITDLNREYLKKNMLNYNILERGFAWLDTGTHDSLLSAGEFVSTIQKRQGLMIACPEEIALRKGWINENSFKSSISKYRKSSYGEYLEKIIQDLSKKNGE